jgi:hypothetical protein
MLLKLNRIGSKNEKQISKAISIKNNLMIFYPYWKAYEKKTKPITVDLYEIFGEILT